jgi:hypothetical protein
MNKTKEKKVVLIQVYGGYKVKKLFNCLTPAIKSNINEKEAQQLISDGVAVEIVEK